MCTNEAEKAKGKRASMKSHRFCFLFSNSYSKFHVGHCVVVLGPDIYVEGMTFLPWVVPSGCPRYMSCWRRTARRGRSMGWTCRTPALEGSSPTGGWSTHCGRTAPSRMTSSVISHFLCRLIGRRVSTGRDPAVVCHQRASVSQREHLDSSLINLKKDYIDYLRLRYQHFGTIKLLLFSPVTQQKNIIYPTNRLERVKLATPSH